MLLEAALSGLRKARILHHVVHSPFPSHIYAQTVLLRAIRGHRLRVEVSLAVLIDFAEIDGQEANTKTDSKTSRS